MLISMGMTTDGVGRYQPGTAKPIGSRSHSRSRWVSFHGWMVEIGPGKASTNSIKFAEFVVVVVVAAVSYNFRIVCGSYLHLI